MSSTYDTSSGAAAILASFGLIGGLIALASLVFGIIIYWKIFSKAGYNGAMSLLLFVPIANIIVLCILAFGEWPIYRELNQLRQMRNAQYQQNPQYPQGSSYPRQ